ncbi:hypothetical protein NQ315_010515 [Exocentrus adspersus]|uniref:HTH psq-type domain-containing protein n=1 Tax=Exocentrus adspersus TaxID=1586481 RepID=A0AAV8W619_9CUCU|nr:hypothetical protein NQ315_010515 [Exocentrus adspersus]
MGDGRAISTFLIAQSITRFNTDQGLRCLNCIMVRNYKRSSKQHPWTEKSMELAIKDIRNGVCGFKTASEKYNLPIGTLQRHVKSNKTSTEAAEQSLGHYKPIFNEQQERELVDYILLMESKLFGLTSRIYNCEETGYIHSSDKPSKILSLKGKNQIGVLSSADRGTLATAEICFNAIGSYIPLLLICPRVRRNPLFEVGLPSESIVEYHPSGWTQSSIFAPTWFNHFLKYAKPSADDPVLLILDGHATHIKNLTLVEMARENNVHILVLPPHTSHRLQPLDVNFMFPLNSYYKQEVKNWLRNNPGQVITVHDTGGLFGAAFQRAASPQNVVSGFKNTGICPYNPNIFPEELFRSADTTDQALLDEDHPSTVEQESVMRTPSPLETDNSINKVPDQIVNTVMDKEQLSNKEISPKPGCSHSVTEPIHQSNYYSPSDILPIPKSQPKQRRQGKRGKTMILTTTPNMNELKASVASIPKEKKKIVKRNLVLNVSSSLKKRKKPKMVAIHSSSGSSYDEFCNDSSTSESDGEDGVISSIDNLSTEKVTLAQIREKDYPVIELQSKDGTQKKKFVAEIQILSEEGVHSLLSGDRKVSFIWRSMVD